MLSDCSQRICKGLSILDSGKVKKSVIVLELEGMVSINYIENLTKEFLYENFCVI
jgi:hypothetical protein